MSACQPEQQLNNGSHGDSDSAVYAKPQGSGRVSYQICGAAVTGPLPEVMLDTGSWQRFTGEAHLLCKNLRQFCVSMPIFCVFLMRFLIETAYTFAFDENSFFDFQPNFGDSRRNSHGHFTSRDVARSEFRNSGKSRLERSFKVQIFETEKENTGPCDRQGDCVCFEPCSVAKHVNSQDPSAFSLQYLTSQHNDIETLSSQFVHLRRIH